MNEQIELIRGCWDESPIQMTWNFSCGDTLKEKFEKLISAVIFMAENSYIDDTDDDNPIHDPYINLYADPQITSIFEVATAGFDPVPYNDKWETENKQDIYKAGVVSFGDKKFNLYKDLKSNQSEILATVENNKFGIKLKIDNFIYV